MTRKIILVFRDRPRLEFLRLHEAGIVAYWADSFREAEELLNRLGVLDAVVVDIHDRVERAIEFCDIVRRTRSELPIVFLRSPNRPKLVPWCANRVLDSETNEDRLAAEIIDLLESDNPLTRKPA